MRRRNVRSWAAGVAGSVAMLGLVGCTSPPSVVPLLEVTERALEAEAARTLADIERDRRQAEQLRRSLTAGFDADLAGRASLDAAWVRDAADALVAAREAVLRHELALERERRERAANLGAAAFAARRAIDLIEQQDALVVGATRLDLWRLLDLQNPRSPRTPNTFDEGDER